MGLVMTKVIKNLEIPVKVEVAKRLTPKTFFIIPSLASVAIASGIYLAQKIGTSDIHSPMDNSYRYSCDNSFRSRFRNINAKRS